MTARAFAGVVGAALVIVGIVLFLLPVSVTVEGQTGRCDSSAAFDGVPSGLLLDNQAYRDFHTECADSASTRHAWSWGLLGLGAVIGLGGAVIRRPETASVA